MKHRHSNRILGRRSHHRLDLLLHLTSSLLEHGAIKTTEAKAKELRSYAEPLLAEAKQELTLARRRRLLSKLLRPQDLPNLINATQRVSRRSGFLRLTKIAAKRSDAAAMAKIEIIF